MSMFYTKAEQLISCVCLAGFIGRLTGLLCSMIERGGRFSLVRDDFQTFTSNSFKNMIAREEFVDVTLACEDDKHVRAHKVILSACSEFFRNILVKNSHPHPLIYLENLKAEQLEALVKFIYVGETNIPQSMVADFIKAAQKYKIQGLTEHNDEVPQTKKRRTGGMNIKEEFIVNEEARGEVLKHNIVDTLANSRSRMLEPETKLEVLEEDTPNGGVQVELTQVDVVESMEESDVENLLVDDEEETTAETDDNVIESKNILSLKRPKDDVDNAVDETSSDKEADYLPNENEEFSEEEDDDEEVGSGGIENTIEIESVIDRNEVFTGPDSDGESIVNDNDSSDSDYDVSGEEESSDDDDEEEEDESIADEDNEFDDESDDTCLEEAEILDSNILVKEESTNEEDESPIDDMQPIQEDERKHANVNNNKRIKKEPLLVESDIESV